VLISYLIKDRMEKDLIINRIVRDMKLFEIIDPVDAEQTKQFMNQLWAACREQTIKEAQAHHKTKIVQYSLQGKKLGEYDSIREAGKAVGYEHKYRGGELTILNVLSGRYKHTKEGHIWKYADNGKD